MSETLRIQTRLKELGFDPGPLDDDFGEQTKAALVAFQKANGLQGLGIVGPKTRQLLWPDRVATLAPNLPAAVPEWLRHAIAEIGTKEVVGRGSNARVLAYRTLGKTTDDQSTEDGSRPWCADFVCAMLESAGIRSPRSGMARAVERTPHFVKLDAPAIGAITTMWRGSKNSGLGHVYFYAGEYSARNVAVGGNQNDAVTAASYGTDRVVGYYWPRSLPYPHTGHVPAVIRPGASAGKET